MAYILYGKNENSNYKNFEIPKKSGGKRQISAPKPELMLIQKRLSELLQDCISDLNYKKQIDNVVSHGFRRNCSIITNASNHKKRRYVFNIDLENYFGAINFGRIYGFFIKNKNFELPPDVSKVIAKIACFKNVLPQGSPCSPVLSNLIGHALDMRLVKLAIDNGCYYSRYADDLTFSTNKKLFPENIAFKNDTEPHIWLPGKKLTKLIENSGFQINSFKTRMLYNYSRQDVTGLVVNSKVNVRSEYWRNVRAMCDSLFKTGKYNIRKLKLNTSSNSVVVEEEGNLDQLHGMLSFIDSVDKFNTYNNQKNSKSHRKNNARERTFKKYLFFRSFYKANRPIILCEGKTDNIYIQAAIKSLSSHFPLLADNMPDGKINIKVKLFKYTEITDRILNLGGGTGDLIRFIGNYSKMCNEYSIDGCDAPIIILIDNDSGAKKIFKYIKDNITNSKVDGGSDYYYITKNLYIVFIPKIAGKDTIIENYFDKDVLETKVSGKSFNPKYPIDKHKEYGKHIFAERVIKKHQSTINFKRFKKILERLSAAINAFGTV